MGRELTWEVSKTNCDCRFCEKRKVGCHSTCETYKQFRDNLDNSKQMVLEGKKKLYGEYSGFKRDQVRKEAKKARYKR